MFSSGNPGRNTSEKHITALLEACKAYKNMNFIFTKTNADTDGRIINRLIDNMQRKMTTLLLLPHWARLIT